MSIVTYTSLTNGMTTISDLPSPRELGYPEKFGGGWRPTQSKALVDLLEWDRRYCGLVMRTGTGKTGVYVARAVIPKPRQRTLIVTQTKGLQDQLLKDFSKVGLVDVRGKSNYECDGLGCGRTCDEGSVSKCPYHNTESCRYVSAKQAAMDSSLVTTNYACWIYANKFGNGWGQFDLLILDEAHAIEPILTQALRITLTENEMFEVLKYDWPSNTKDMEDWKAWARIGYIRADMQVQFLKTKLARESKPTDKLVKEYRATSNIHRKLQELKGIRPDNWRIHTLESGFQFDPVETTEYWERFVFHDIPKVIITSGTIRPKTLRIAGIGDEEFDFFEYEEEVKPSKSPIIHIPTVKVDRKTTNEGLQLLVKRIDEIYDIWGEYKGIIHTSNFALRDYITTHSRYRKYMMSNYVGSGDVTSEVIERFKLSRPPMVLISPSVTVGYDFSGDLARWQIIAKVPFPDESDPISQERKRLDPNIGPYKTMQSLLQAWGRPDRGPDDWAVTFVLDDNIGWFLQKYGHMAPPYFGAYYSNMLTILKPEERLTSV